MFIIIGEITICLFVVLVFGLIMGWNLAINKKEKEFLIVSDKYLQAERELKEVKKELLDCKNSIISEHTKIGK